MRFISSLCWVKKGCSKTPVRIKFNKDEMKDIFNESKFLKNNDDDDETNQLTDEENQNSLDGRDQFSDSENRKINKKYKLDDYDDEGILTLDKIFKSNSQITF